jgi:hypothetical protein
MNSKVNHSVYSSPPLVHIMCPEDGNNMFLRNIGIYLRHNPSSRRIHSTSSYPNVFPTIYAVVSQVVSDPPLGPTFPHPVANHVTWKQFLSFFLFVVLPSGTVLG